MANDTIIINKGTPGCKGETMTVPIENGTRLRITCAKCPLDWTTKNNVKSDRR